MSRASHGISENSFAEPSEIRQPLASGTHRIGHLTPQPLQPMIDQVRKAVVRSNARVPR